jgi:Carbohydrate binding module (family 6)
MYPSRLRPRRWRLVAATAAIALPLVAMAAALGSANASVPPPPPGWTTVFSDDFTGAAGTGLNTANWLYDLGTGYPGGAANWGTGEVETMTNSTTNVFQDGQGHLAIRPVRDGAGNWTSGRIETQRTDFAAPVGGKLRVEASIQQPNVSGAAAAGYWPAFWMLGAAARPVGATNWPGIGEIDIMEDINGRSSEFATLHCGVAPGGPCNEFTGLGSGERSCAGCQTGFHTYAMEYDRSVSPEQIRWYLDGANFFTLNSTQVDATTWNNATHHGFFVILNVAMGGAFPAAFGGGPTGSTQSGVPMLVDYVSVMTSGGGPTSPPPSTSPPPPSGSATQYLRSGGTLGAAGTAGADTIVSAGGANHDGTPTNPVTYTASGLTMSYTGGSTNFDLFVDSGTSVANAIQARVSYDLTGDGTYDRVETYNYFATDPVPGYEHYTQAQGLRSVSGALGALANGRVKIEVWSAIGSGTSTLGVGNQSVLTLPFSGSSTTPPPPSTTPPPGGTRNAYSTIQAESYDAQSGTIAEPTTDTGGGQDLGYIANGDWARYDNVDFGSTPATQFLARVASGAAGGVSGLVEVRLDSLGSNPIGSFGIGNTGGWQVWKTVPANISGVTGVHTVYVTFTSGQPADFVNLNWFTFGH